MQDDSIWDEMLTKLLRAYEEERVQYALQALRIDWGPGKCAPAIGVHVGCEHAQ